MSVNIEEKKTEAIERMKALGIFPQTIEQFERDGYISISEPPVGAFFWAEDEDLQRIYEFEANYNALVYLVIRSYTTIGKMDSYFLCQRPPRRVGTGPPGLGGGRAAVLRLQPRYA